MLRPIRASEWVTFNKAAQGGLLALGALPVNDIYFDYLDQVFDILLIRGGRGGGKSEFVADRYVKACCSRPYFKLYHGRKVFEKVRESTFATLVHSVKKSGIHRHDFYFSEADNSPMVITHRPSGNKMIPFGSDKPDKLKSIKDPSHVWAEEFDQFTLNDLTEILPTLRTPRGDNEFLATFNTHGVHLDHWIIRLFFPELYTGEDKDQLNMLDGLNIGHIFANFTDNHFIDQVLYDRKLRASAGGRLSIYEGIAHGAWGVVENDDPWLHDFNAEVHVVDKLPFLPSFPIYLSFDFNNDPFACIAVQFSPNKGNGDSFIHFIKEFSGKHKVDKMCEEIKQQYPASIIYLTGDRSGKNEDLGRNQTLYQMIASYLGVSDRLINTPDANLEHADSRLLCNVMFRNYPNIKISAAGCPNLVRQCEAARIDEKSNKPSQLLKDRAQHKNDEFDGMRYFFQTYFHKFAKDHYLRIIKK